MRFFKNNNKTLSDKCVHSDKCDHSINSESNTLIKVSKRVLTHPEIIDFYCGVCHACFRYKKENKDFILIDSDEEAK